MTTGPEQIPTIDVGGLRAALESGDGTPRTVVDVREEHEFVTGHVPGALNVPLTTFVDRVAEVTARPGEVYLICQSGNRSGQATAWLAQQGHEVVNVAGGTGAWRAAGFPLD